MWHGQMLMDEFALNPPRLLTAEEREEQEHGEALKRFLVTTEDKKRMAKEYLDFTTRCAPCKLHTDKRPQRHLQQRLWLLHDLICLLSLQYNATCY
jgi:hypothetical protein